MAMSEARRELLVDLREGDIIRLNGRLRVVRKVTEHRDPCRGRKKGYPPRRCFTFAILRCSWTHRPYTTYTTSDLGNPKWSVERVARNYRPKSAVEIELNEQIALSPAIRPALTCCAIHGVS